MLKKLRRVPKLDTLTFLMMFPIFIMMIISTNIIHTQIKISYNKIDSELINIIEKYEPAERNITDINKIRKIEESKYKIKYTYTQDNGKYKYDGTTGELNINDIKDEKLSFTISDRNSLDNKDLSMDLVIILIFVVTLILVGASIVGIHDDMMERW